MITSFHLAFELDLNPRSVKSDFVCSEILWFISAWLFVPILFVHWTDSWRCSLSLTFFPEVISGRSVPLSMCSHYVICKLPTYWMLYLQVFRTCRCPPSGPATEVKCGTHVNLLQCWIGKKMSPGKCSLFIFLMSSLKSPSCLLFQGWLF